jgi:GNAT superfamily N-acetyltransferase
VISIREARDSDTSGIIDIYLATYGQDYAYPQYYEDYEIKKLIFSDETLMLVAEDEETGLVVGTASVILEVGAYTDLVGEFGRLAVHPDYRKRGIGTRLLEQRLLSVKNRLHVGIIEARITHPFTQAIALKQGFAPVGFLPQKYLFGTNRENMGLLVQLFGRGRELRRNNPRIVPEVYQLAGTALENCRVSVDVIVDEESTPYPFGHGFTVSELTTEGYSRLLRIERGRVRNREIFGPMRLQYGYFKLISHHSKYLVAREGSHIVGAVGFTLERLDRVVRVFELISLQDDVIRFLLSELERRCREEWEIAYMELDVSAHAPRMQRTVLQLGFVPTAYIPALAFDDVERLDLVKFSKLLIPLEIGQVMLIPPVSDLADLVLTAFRRREVLPRLGEVVDRVDLFAGLEEEQLQRLAGACTHGTFRPGTDIFVQGQSCEEMYLILEGKVAIHIDGRSEPIGTVRAGECLGEIAVLTGGEHSATARAVTPVEVGILRNTDLQSLVRLRPGIGVVLYRNLARGLGEKLRRTDLHLGALD